MADQTSKYINKEYYFNHFMQDILYGYFRSHPHYPAFPSTPGNSRKAARLLKARQRNPGKVRFTHSVTVDLVAQFPLMSQQKIPPPPTHTDTLVRLFDSMILFSISPLDITHKAHHNRLMVYRHRFSVVPSNHVMGVERGTEV